MRPLRFVALSEDGSHLVLAPDVPDSIDNGERFSLPVDERLSAAARGDMSRLGQIEVETESNLRPREIQARIRAGETPEAVAAAAGARLEKVMRYAYPVLQERAQIAERAQQARVKLDDTSQTPTLRELIASRLAVAGADPESIDWDARRIDDGVWEVSSSWRTPDKTVTATWRYDVTARTVIPNDRDTVELVEPPKPTPPPRLSTVGRRLGELRPATPAIGEPADERAPAGRGESTPFGPGHFVQESRADLRGDFMGSDGYDPDDENTNLVAGLPEVPGLPDVPGATGTESYPSDPYADPRNRPRRPRRSIRERFVEHAATPPQPGQVPYPLRPPAREDPDAVGLDDLLEPDVPEFGGDSRRPGAEFGGDSRRPDAEFGGDSRRPGAATSLSPGSSTDAAAEPAASTTDDLVEQPTPDPYFPPTRPSVVGRTTPARRPAQSKRQTEPAKSTKPTTKPPAKSAEPPTEPKEPAAQTPPSAVPAAQAEESADEAPARTRSSRDRKPRIPAWDDIVFGVKRRP